MGQIYSRIKIPLWLILSGLLTSLPLIFSGLAFLQWISMIPMAVILMQKAFDKSIKLRRIYVMGLLYFWAYYALSFHWFFYMYPLDFAGLSDAASLAVVLLACFGLGLFQAIQSAFAFLLFGFITRNPIFERYKLLKPFCGASLFVIFEWWQTVGWWGVPWARLPLGQIDATLLVRSSAIFGSYFVTFVIAAVNLCLALAVLEKKLIRLALASGILMFSINAVLGSIVTVTYREGGETVRVAAAQGNISSNEKWSGDSERIIQIYRRLTEDAAESGAEIVVWPETALPYVLFNNHDLVDFVSELARENNITIILSAFTKDEESGQNHNSIIEVRPDGTFGEDVYSKQKLVPFGEFVPMREFVAFVFPPLADIGMLENDLLAGDESVVIETDRGNIGCGLCFDSIYESVIREAALNGAEIIAISTNDSWFSDSAALDMHNAQSRLRAIESGRYVVRSANTGISSIIDPLGNVKDELPALERGYVISDVYMKEENTVYTHIGNMFVYVCIAWVVADSVFCIVCKLNIKNIKKNEI